VATLHRARAIGLEAGLRYVYEGNVPGGGGEDTLCPQCGQVVVKRAGFDVYASKLQGGRCSVCGAAIAGVW
jgi:pyruvate formate lyase activating enzyme